MYYFPYSCKDVGLVTAEKCSFIHQCTLSLLGMFQKQPKEFKNSPSENWPPRSRMEFQNSGLFYHPARLLCEASWRSPHFKHLELELASFRGMFQHCRQRTRYFLYLSHSNQDSQSQQQQQGLLLFFFIRLKYKKCGA